MGVEVLGSCWHFKGTTRQKKRHISAQTIAAAAMEQIHLPMLRNQAAVTLATKFGKRMPAYLGLLDEERMSSNASASITENDWTPRERKDAVLKGVSESTRSSVTSTSPQEGVSATATCTYTT